MLGRLFRIKSFATFSALSNLNALRCLSKAPFLSSTGAWPLPLGANSFRSVVNAGRLLLLNRIPLAISLREHAVKSPGRMLLNRIGKS